MHRDRLFDVLHQLVKRLCLCDHGETDALRHVVSITFMHLYLDNPLHDTYFVTNWEKSNRCSDRCCSGRSQFCAEAIQLGPSWSTMAGGIGRSATKPRGGECL